MEFKNNQIFEFKGKSYVAIIDKGFCGRESCNNCCFLAPKDGCNAADLSCETNMGLYFKESYSQKSEFNEILIN